MPKVSTAPKVAADTGEIALQDIVSFDAFRKQYSNIGNEPRLRWWIFHRKSNGLEASGAIIKREGRWYFVVPRFRSWLLQEPSQAA